MASSNLHVVSICSVLICLYILMLFPVIVSEIMEAATSVTAEGN